MHYSLQVQSRTTFSFLTELRVSAPDANADVDRQAELVSV